MNIEISNENSLYIRIKLNRRDPRKIMPHEWAPWSLTLSFDITKYCWISGLLFSETVCLSLPQFSVKEASLGSPFSQELKCFQVQFGNSVVSAIIRVRAWESSLLGKIVPSGRASWFVGLYYSFWNVAGFGYRKAHHKKSGRQRVWSRMFVPYAMMKLRTNCSFLYRQFFFTNNFTLQSTNEYNAMKYLNNYSSL